MRARTAPAALLVIGSMGVIGNIGAIGAIGALGAPGFTAASGAGTAAGAAPAAETGLWSAGETALRGAGRDYLVATAAGERAIQLPAGVEVEELFALRRSAFLSARGPLSAAAPAARRRDLFLALVDSQGVHELPTPRLDAGRVRENAVPLASAGGDLEGVVWLEGADRQHYAIHHAGWDGRRWSEPVVIAAEAPGSQLALAGATLADGSKLLVWSRFDGHDDEVVAARLLRGRWSAPQAIAPDNAVPDVTPAVIAVPGGALAAWSRYDGHDYRVVISHFDGREWSAPTWAGPAGSTVPFLIRAGAGGDAAGQAPAWLTFASARPRGWTVLELDSAGRVLRQGSVADVPTLRPALAAQPSGELRLRWAAVETDVELK